MYSITKIYLVMKERHVLNARHLAPFMSLYAYGFSVVAPPHMPTHHSLTLIGETNVDLEGVRMDAQTKYSVPSKPNSVVQPTRLHVSS